VSKMRKRVIRGWVAKRPKWGARWEHEELRGVFRTRGDRGEWGGDDWPPRKVKITIEEV